MFPKDLLQPLTQETNGERWCTLAGPTVASRGILRGLDKLKVRLLAGLANTVAKQTQMNLLLEKPIPQATSIWKREGGKFSSDAGTWKRWQAQALTINLSACKMDTLSFIGRGSGGR